MSRKSGQVESSEYAGFVRRAIRAFGRRAAEDVDALALLATVAEEARVAVNVAIVGCHEAGYSYAEIAARLGCSKQAVAQRVASLTPAS